MRLDSLGVLVREFKIGAELFMLIRLRFTDLRSKHGVKLPDREASAPTSHKSWFIIYKSISFITFSGAEIDESQKHEF